MEIYKTSDEGDANYSFIDNIGETFTSKQI